MVKQIDQQNLVIYLSNHKLTVDQKILLNLGPGFCPTTTATYKHQETLSLEGFRVLDRIGKLTRD